MTANLPPSKPPAEVHPMQALLEQGGYDMPQRRGYPRRYRSLGWSPGSHYRPGPEARGDRAGADLSRLDKDTLAEVQGRHNLAGIHPPDVRSGREPDCFALPRAAGEGLARRPEDDGMQRDLRGQGHRLQQRRAGGGLRQAPRFVPASHISTLPRNASEDDRKERLAGYVGKTVPVKVVEVDRRRRRSDHVGARRSSPLAARASQAVAGRDCRSAMCARVSCAAWPTSVSFIDLGGADGLVHISELAWFPVAHPSEVLKVGQEVEVKVLRVDRGPRAHRPEHQARAARSVEPR